MTMAECLRSPIVMFRISAAIRRTMFLKASAGLTPPNGEGSTFLKETARLSTSLTRMSGKPLSRLGTLRRRLLAWYRSSARPLPWRKTHNPYRILVSEVMLQQTQVNRVLIHYRRFLKRFPTLRSLSRAGTADVLRAWRGMGYNNRAVRLRNLAKEVCATMGGRLPGTVGALRSLPGIGRYTAGAVACFAVGLPVAMVDTNIQRVFNRLFP